MNRLMRFLPVNNGNKWIKLLNSVNLHKLLEESPPKKRPNLCLLEGGDNIIRLAVGITVYC